MKSLTPLQKLQQWRHEQIEKAREKNEEFFLGLPDNWYEPSTYACDDLKVNLPTPKCIINGKSKVPYLYQ